MSTLEMLRRAVVDGQVSTAVQITNRAVEEGIAPGAIFESALAPAMDEVGKLMQRNEYFIPEVLVSAKAMKASSELLKPLIVQSGLSQTKAKVILGTVKGDLHDIGKNLVSMMLEGAGFEVVDLGTDVTAERFVEAVKESQPQVLGMSALLTTTMLQMSKVIEALEREELRAGIRVMVGGAPLNQSYADEIGADGFGMDASTAVQMVKTWTVREQEG